MKRYLIVIEQTDFPPDKRVKMLNGTCVRPSNSTSMVFEKRATRSRNHRRPPHTLNSPSNQNN